MLESATPERRHVPVDLNHYGLRHQLFHNSGERYDCATRERLYQDFLVSYGSTIRVCAGPAMFFRPDSGVGFAAERMQH